MGKITLNEALKKASVKNDLQMFLGLDAQSELGGMTPERLAAVAGESILKSKRILSGDLNDCRDAGFVMVGSDNVSNVPIPFVYVIILSSLSSQDVMQIAFGIQNKMIYIRSYNNNLWNEWRQI